MTGGSDACLNPLRPEDDGQEVEVQVDHGADGQQGVEAEDDDEIACGECKIEDRAEAEDDARKPKPAARP